MGTLWPARIRQENLAGLNDKGGFQTRLFSDLKALSSF